MNTLILDDYTKELANLRRKRSFAINRLRRAEDDVAAIKQLISDLTDEITRKAKEAA